MTDLQRLLKKGENDLSEALGLKPGAFLLTFCVFCFIAWKLGRESSLGGEIRNNLSK